MLDFAPLWARQSTLTQIMESQSVDDLRRLATETTTTIEQLLADCTDADVVFVPHDLQADDPGADEEERTVGWTLGHIIVHVTAGAEDTSFLAAELARGVPHHGRSRYEVPWEQITTIAQVQQRLAESQRMRLATIELWPDQPHLDVTTEMEFLGEYLNAKGYFGLGLMHDGMHFAQVAETVRQAKAARES